MLVHWYTGTQLIWYTVILVYWHTVNLVHWYTVILVYWHTVNLVHWYTVILVYWHTVNLVYCYIGILAHCYTGTLLIWYTGDRNRPRYASIPVQVFRYISRPVLISTWRQPGNISIGGVDTDSNNRVMTTGKHR